MYAQARSMTLCGDKQLTESYYDEWHCDDE